MSLSLTKETTPSMDGCYSSILQLKDSLTRHELELESIRTRLSSVEARVNNAEGRITDHHHLLVELKGDLSLVKHEQKQITEIVTESRKTIQEIFDVLNKYVTSGMVNMSQLSKNIFWLFVGVLILLSALSAIFDESKILEKVMTIFTGV